VKCVFLMLKEGVREKREIAPEIAVHVWTDGG
jgi:hypothetical protein